MISLKRILSTHSFRMRVFSGLTMGMFGFCLLMFTFWVSGCTPLTDEPGEVVIGLTDTEGEFVRYAVDILSLSLTKADGTIVETLPFSTEVDFAQYTEMTEFLTAASIPSGSYVKATLILDYSEKDIWIEKNTGDAEKIHTVLDVERNSITTLEVSVYLDGPNSLIIAPGIPEHLTLDFNLEASNKIDDVDPNILIVHPLLLADVSLKAPKVHRLRGPLKEVNPDQGNFLVIIRPFIHIISGGDEHFGVLRVTTNSNTIFVINGNLYNEQDGLDELNELNTLSPYTATIVIGDLKAYPRRFEAREVRAGSDVPGGILDVITGNVTSRDPNSLIVKGATLIRTNNSIVFNDTATIYLDANTRVSRQFSTDIYNTNDISIGQRITVFGNLDPNSGDLELNADFVHLQLTTLRGTVNSTSTLLHKIYVNLSSIDGRRITIFDFEGTGIDIENDADPNNYDIGTDNLNISSLHTGSPVKVLGFVNAFGMAPMDFKAQTIVDVSGVSALLNVGWLQADPNAFENLSAEGITLNLDGVGLFHHVGRAGIVIDLNELSELPTIKPDPEEGGAGFFSISQEGTRKLHTSFENFVTDLEERLAENASVKHVIAIGSFNDSNSTLTARYINVLLVE